MNFRIHVFSAASLFLLAFFFCYQQEKPEGVRGIDVSRYQASIDWAQVAEEGVRFAYMKATEGESITDPGFAENWVEADAAGLIRGAYHFYRPDIDSRDQFENFAALVKLKPGDLPPVLDIETLDQADKVSLITGVRTWLYLAEIRYGIKPIIYTNLKFYYHHLAGHFDDYPFWIARYGNTPPSLSTTARLAFWQYSDSGRIPGIDGEVDLNLFLGTESDLRDLCVPEEDLLALY